MIDKSHRSNIANNFWCKYINFRNWIRSKGYRIHATEYPGIYRVVDDNDGIIFICRKDRRFRYKNGINQAVMSLARTYHLDSLSPKTNGIFIDCGANVGELGLWARSCNLSYCAFEPEELERRCCDLNNFSAKQKTHRFALWKEDATLVFYSKPESGDSSLFELDHYEGKKEIEAVALHHIIDPNEFIGTRILKIEAEGAEPEVLQGAQKILQSIDYVTVDCGYERGIDKKHTFVEVNNFLVDHGFRLEKAGFKRITALYRNVSRNS